MPDVHAVPNLWEERACDGDRLESSLLNTGRCLRQILIVRQGGQYEALQGRVLEHIPPGQVTHGIMTCLI
jgi:hypothetical protein